MPVIDPRWTTQQIDKAKELWLSGNTATQVSQVVGKTRSAVVGKMKRLGLLKRDTAVPAPIPVRKLKVPQPPTPLPPVTPPATSSLNPVPLAKLKPQHCRAILGDVGADGFAIYCGDPKAEGSSYCAFHHGLYTQPLTPRMSHGQTGRR